MKALVSGGNGFIGKRLTEILIQQEYKVWNIDRETLGNPIELSKCVMDIKPDYIFHLAAYGNHYDQKDINEILATNILKTFFLLQATQAIDYKAFINVGSSSEYGKKKSTMHEDDCPETDTFYGATKVAATYLARAFAKQYNKPIVTIRPFSVYGPGESSARLIPSIIDALHNNKLFPLDPEPKHDWIYIDDLIDGILIAAHHAKELSGDVVNVGTGKQYTNLDVANMLEKISDKSLSIDYMNSLRNYDSTYWLASNSLLKFLGWTQKHTLKEGLKKTYDYYTK